MSDNVSNTRIKKLSPLLINQLAAGEVVTRPAAVVKELLENAIDAGATYIEVRITQGGMGMIEVVDNGEGIHPDDMVMAITRHATSKVADVAHLHGITTLGFRGEALAATAAVSRLSLISSHDDSGIGRQLQVAGVLDDTPKLFPVVHNRGTTVLVKDLYFNVPARRGNLKSIATEFSYIETIVREVALAHADVTLDLFHDNKKRLSLSTADSSNNSHSRLPLARLEQALGLLLADDAIEVIVDLSSLVQQSTTVAASITHNTTQQTSNKQASISGWLWPIHESQSSLPKLLYMNGRLVKEPLISNELRQLASSAQLKGIGYALYFELPNSWLNINVHPSKQRIKISPLNNIMAHLNHTIGLKLKRVTTSHTLVNKGLPEQSFVNQALTPNKLLLNPPLTTATSVANALQQQVQSAQQQYQLSKQPTTARPSRKISAYSTKNSTQNQLLGRLSAAVVDSVAPYNYVSNSAPFSTKPIILPQCLSVINNLPSSLKMALDQESTTTTKADVDLLSLPWLLFCNQGQLLLVSKQAWQQNIALLFNPDLFAQNETLKDAATINRKIAKAASILTPHDLKIFMASFEQVLNNSAFKSINTEQLVAFMLSPTS